MCAFVCLFDSLFVECYFVSLFMSSSSDEDVVLRKYFLLNKKYSVFFIDIIHYCTRFEILILFIFKK